MLYTGSIITIDKENREQAVSLIEGYPQIEIHTFSADGLTAVVTIEAEHSKELEELTEELQKNTLITDISHHFMHFGEESEKLLNNIGIDETSDFFKSARMK